MSFGSFSIRFDRDVKTELPNTLIGRAFTLLRYEPGPGESVHVHPTELELNKFLALVKIV